MLICLAFLISFVICKAQKAKDKEENEQLMEELDKNFTALVESEALLSLTDPAKINALKALVNPDFTGEKSGKSESLAKKKGETVLQVGSYHSALVPTLLFRAHIPISIGCNSHSI